MAYASQAHNQLLPNGDRKGFFLGDGAGVGKGRQLAGLVQENFIRGRMKHIWLSSSADLAIDARRDLVGIPFDTCVCCIIILIALSQIWLHSRMIFMLGK